MYREGLNYEGSKGFETKSGSDSSNKQVQRQSITVDKH